jgi:hypothetical protein
MISVLSRGCVVGMMMVLLALAYAGCVPSPPADGPKTENQVRDEKKIQELSRKGYDFGDIRLIMKGEKPKSQPKKKPVRARR